jgi:hypothetical protein
MAWLKAWASSWFFAPTMSVDAQFEAAVSSKIDETKRSGRLDLAHTPAREVSNCHFPRNRALETVPDDGFRYPHGPAS